MTAALVCDDLEDPDDYDPEDEMDAVTSHFCSARCLAGWAAQTAELEEH